MEQNHLDTHLLSALRNLTAAPAETAVYTAVFDSGTFLEAVRLLLRHADHGLNEQQHRLLRRALQTTSYGQGRPRLDALQKASLNSQLLADHDLRHRFSTGQM